MLCTLVYLWCMLWLGIAMTAGLCDYLDEKESDRMRGIYRRHLS
jgi:hypothetical protein